ncbi:uncharacterized protein METZ01_LOCUS384895, partial [marine metagenome]
MKSNITKMITMCMCMMVVGFASDSKKALVETKDIKSSPAYQKIQDTKKLWLESQQTEPVSFSPSYVAEKDAQKAEYYQSLKPNYEPGHTGTNPNTNPESDSRDATVEVYFCTDWYPSESTFNVCNDDEGWCVWDPAYGAGWIGSNACYSEYVSLPDGAYTLHLNDSYGDGGLCAGVYSDGAELSAMTCMDYGT